MDLFRVERYMGDDDQDRGSPEKEESRLRQLYLEIERRKRKLEETKASGLDETHAQTSSQRRKKTKKAKKQREPERAECSKRIDRDPEVTSKSRKGKRRSDGAENADETIAASSTDDVEVRKLKGVKDKEKYETSKSKESQAKQKRKGSPTDKAKRTELSKEPEKLESARNRRQKEYNKSELKGSTLGVTCEDDEDEVPPEYEVQNGGDLVEQQSVTGDEEVMLNPAGYTVIGGHKNEQQIQVKKVQRMLPEWLVKPTVVDADLNGKLLPVGQLTCLNKQLIAKLEQQNMTHLFPVQSAVIPVVLSHSFSAYQPRDLCVSAPTGSGKTLAYVLPIVHSLMGRVVCHLRALVLLPTKDLANQVRQVFDLFTQGTSLKVGLATGTKSFAKEQEMIAGQNFGGGTSQVDILVCTPGRLVDHITSTPHFTLQHLRFLVIDEADRLLDQSYHGWLGKVLKAAYNTEHEEDTRSLCCRLQTVRYPPSAQTASSMSSIQLPLQKLLFSATMTHSPEKLAPLQLYQPVLFMVTQSAAPANDDDAEGADDSLSWYSTPSGLTEYMTICNSGEKPLVVLHFLIQLKFQNVLCFTSSIESTHRLHLLLKLHGGITVAEYSSSLTTQQRRGILRDFRGGKLQLLICSDAMARGMDIDSVQYVISYDAPNYVKGYIHRVGRTARAGNKGTAFTLLHSEEAHHFKELIRKTGREKIAKFRVKDDDLHPLIPEYQESLGKLQEVLAQEHQRQSQSRGNEKVLRFLQQQIKDNLMNIEVDQN